MKVEELDAAPGWSLRRSFAGGLYFASLFTVVWPSAPYKDPQRNAVYSPAALDVCWYIHCYRPHVSLLLSAPGLLGITLVHSPITKYPQVTNHDVPSMQRTRKERLAPRMDTCSLLIHGRRKKSYAAPRSSGHLRCALVCYHSSRKQCDDQRSSLPPLPSTVRSRDPASGKETRH